MSPPLPSSSRHLSEEDRVILVMGPTGVGKSTFINTATRQDGSTVGHGLKSFTSDIKPVAIKGRDGHPLVFVDTPGFDDTYKSDMQILAEIATWLISAYREHVKLAGILYLHRITDPRMSGSALKNLRVFTGICGMSKMPNVVLATTFWGQVESGTGEQREAELKGTFWKEMLEEGCKTMPFHGGQKSAWAIIDYLLSKEPTHLKPAEMYATAGRRPKSHQNRVLVSAEMVDYKKSLNETEAGRALAKELKKLVADQKRASEQLRKLVDQPHNMLAVDVLQAEIKEIEMKVLNTSVQLRLLKIPFAKRFLTKLFGRQQPER